MLSRLDTVERDGQLDFEEFTAAFKGMAAHEIDVRLFGAVSDALKTLLKRFLVRAFCLMFARMGVQISSIRRKMLDIRSEITAERAATSAAEQAAATDAAKIGNNTSAPPVTT